MLLTIIAFLFVFTVITLVHEGGHLIFAKRCGIRVHEFGIGYGPTLFKFDRNNTTYKINLLPILGFVSIAGLETDDPREKETPENEKYYNKTPWQKFVPILGGPLMNLVLGFAIFAILFIFNGIPAGVTNEIATVSPGSPAAKAGILTGDKLVTINKQSYKDPMDAINFIHQNPGKEVSLTLQRGTALVNVKATPKLNEKMKIGLLGFSLKTLTKHVNPFEAIFIALKETVGLSITIVILFGKLILGKFALTDLAGPVGIAQVTGQYAQLGLVSLLNFLAFFSINVAVFNLLPIPALDGGRLAFICIEAVFRKPVKIELENKIHYYAFLGFLALIALVTINDLLRFFH